MKLTAETIADLEKILKDSPQILELLDVSVSQAILFLIGATIMGDAARIDAFNAYVNQQANEALEEINRSQGTGNETIH